MEKGKSDIVEFYKGKNLFLTGATGFLGRVIVEQLLRKCDVKKFYLLIRKKKGMESTQRFHEMFNCPLFDKVKEMKPNFIEKMELVEGDASLPGLGLTESTRALLIEKIEIVIHGAATVKFDEHIQLATAINVRAAREITILAQEMKQLKSFVHVSTAFSNCTRTEIDECFYEPPITADNLIKLTESLKETQLADILNVVLGDWPNTYVFTKVVGEDAVKCYGKGLPACVFRPAIVVGSYKEPVEGWIDNVYGPSGYVVAVGAGLIRTIPSNPRCRAEFVPVDLAVNALLAAAYKTSLMGPTREMNIYNFTSSRTNSLDYGSYMGYSFEFGNVMPSNQSVWSPSVALIKWRFLFILYSFLVHTLPAAVIDLILVIFQRKPRALKIYTKINKFIEVLSYFSMRSWHFHNNNVQALWSGMSQTDKELFNMDMNSVDWKECVGAMCRGARLYLFKESTDTIPSALKRHFWLNVIRRGLQALLLALLLWSTSSLFIPKTLST